MNQYESYTVSVETTVATKHLCNSSGFSSKRNYTATVLQSNANVCAFSCQQEWFVSGYTITTEGGKPLPPLRGKQVNCRKTQSHPSEAKFVRRTTGTTNEGSGMRCTRLVKHYFRSRHTFQVGVAQRFNACSTKASACGRVP